MTEDLQFLLYGTREPQPVSSEVSAGPLTITLEDGNLRTIRFMGHEVLRGVSFLVRDKDWGTCRAEISDFTIDTSDRQFAIRYRARYAAPSGAHLDCEMEISGDAAGKIEFGADYVADADFETARAGFTILHPLAGVAGQPVTVRHGDGLVELSRWPELIDPWQPFMDMTAITHAVAHGIEAETRFEGDVFEMEDQRNWTDGSYKTYVRPLARPWPYMVEKGLNQRQSVAVTIRSAADAIAAPAPGGSISVMLAPTDIVLPEIGVGLRPECLSDELGSLSTLEQLGARHLIAHFDPVAGHGLAALKGYADIARKSGLKVTLELAAPCIRPLDDELSEIASLVREGGLLVDTLFVSPSVDRQSTPPGSKWPDCPPLEQVYAAARKAFPNVRLGGGMLSYFTELNRKRVAGHLIDYISHCTNPIVHAADDLSVMQTFEALSFVVKSIRAIYGEKPYRIGPSTIAMRQNPYGSATKDNPGLGRIPMANVDPRHNAQFAAAWTLAYAATVAAAGLEVLTLSTLAGSFGLIAGKDEPVKEGALRPLAHVISALAALSGSKVEAATTSRPSAVLGLCARLQDGSRTLLLANITTEQQTVVLDASVAIEMLDLAANLGGSFTPVTSGSRLELGPYACARVLLR
jgi:hypothetical protein